MLLEYHLLTLGDLALQLVVILNVVVQDLEVGVEFSFFRFKFPVCHMVDAVM